MGNLPYSYAIEASGGETDVQYAVRVEGDVEKSEAFGATINDGDRVFEIADGVFLLVGSVWGGLDAYDYAGERTAIAVSDPSRVTIHIDNGQERKSVSDLTRFQEWVEWADRPRRDGGGSGNVQGRELVLASNNEADYEFVLESGSIVAHSPEGPDEVTDNGRRAAGHLGGGEDSFTLSNPVFASVSFDGPLTATLDGESVSGDDLRALGRGSRGGGGGRGGSSSSGRGAARSSDGYLLIPVRSDDPAGAPNGATWLRGR